MQETALFDLAIYSLCLWGDQRTASFACTERRFHFVYLVRLHIRRPINLSTALMARLCMFSWPSIWPDTPWLTHFWADSLPCMWKSMSTWLLDVWWWRSVSRLFSDVFVYSLGWSSVWNLHRHHSFGSLLLKLFKASLEDIVSCT